MTRLTQLAQIYVLLFSAVTTKPPDDVEVDVKPRPDLFSPSDSESMIIAGGCAYSEPTSD